MKKSKDYQYFILLLLSTLISFGCYAKSFPNMTSQDKAYKSSSITLKMTDLTPLDMSASLGSTTTRTITIEGYYLTEGISFNLTGTDAAQFSLSDYGLPLFADSVRNTTITIRYTPTDEGVHTALLNILSTSPSATILRTISGSCDLSHSRNNSSTSKIIAFNGKIFFSALATDRVLIFNSVGQCIRSMMANDGINTIEIGEHGVYIISISNKTTKVVI